MSGLVIIGASYAGIQAALSARDAGYAEPVTVVADEKSLPYQRPPLSKDFLLGETSEQNLVLRDDAFSRTGESIWSWTGAWSRLTGQSGKLCWRTARG